MLFSYEINSSNNVIYEALSTIISNFVKMNNSSNDIYQEHSETKSKK